MAQHETSLDTIFTFVPAIYKIETQCWVNVGPPSTTLAHICLRIWCMSRIRGLRLMTISCGIHNGSRGNSPTIVTQSNYRLSPTRLMALLCCEYKPFFEQVWRRKIWWTAAHNKCLVIPWMLCMLQFTMNLLQRPSTPKALLHGVNDPWVTPCATGPWRTLRFQWPMTPSPRVTVNLSSQSQVNHKLLIYRDTIKLFLCIIGTNTMGLI